MTFEAVTLLAVSTACVLAVAVMLRDRFWSRLGGLFLCAMVLYHGIAELLTAMSPGRSRYRVYVERAAVDRWLIWITAAIAVFTVSYLATVGKKGRRAPRPLTRNEARFFDWRVCGVVTLPIYLLALTGGGFVSGADKAGRYLEAGVASQFLLLGVVFTAYGYAVKTGRVARVLVLQSVALVLLGQRLAVIAALVMIAFLLGRQGFRPSRKQVLGVAVLGLVAAVSLSSARLAVGRQEFGGNSGPGARAEALAAGFTGLADKGTRDRLADDYVYRIDGNAMPALLLDRGSYGAVGFTTVRNSLKLSVPSFLNPSKLTSHVSERNEKGYLIQHYGLPAGVDFLPTILGGTVAYYGPVAMLVFAALFGLALGMLDRWLDGTSPARSVLAAGAVACIAYYDSGVEVIPITMRGAFVLGSLVWLIHRAHRAWVGKQVMARV